MNQQFTDIKLPEGIELNDGRKRIVIQLHKNTGEIESRVVGAVGAECTSMQQPIMSIGQVLLDEKTPAFYEQRVEIVNENLQE